MKLCNELPVGGTGISGYGTDVLVSYMNPKLIQKLN
jgi:hypothetical protein